MSALIGVWDYIILIFMLIISIAIGLYYKYSGGKQKTIEEYLYANKSMACIPTAFSLMATYTAGSVLLGMPSETYKAGLVLVNMGILYPICAVFVTQFILPVYFEHKISTPFEYLYKRFGYTSQLLISVMCSLQSILYMGVGLYAPAISLEALIGINEITAIFIVGGICILYSVLGGMKGVIVTDVFQAILMFSAVFSLVISSTIDAGGIKEFWSIINKGQRLNFFKFNIDPTETYTMLSSLLSGAILFLSAHATSQSQVQRYFAVKDLKTAKMALLISSPLSSVFLIMCGLCGLAAFTKYHDCDPVKSGKIRELDQLIPLYISEALNNVPGLAGLMITGVFSGTLSSLSSVVNGLSATTISDYINPFYRMFLNKELEDKSATILVKILVVFYGIICILVAMMAKYFGGITKGVIQIYGAVGGPVLGFFLLGIFTTSTNQITGLTGYISGTIITFWMTIGGPRPPPVNLPVSIEGCIKIRYNFTDTPTVPSTFDASEYFWLYRISYLYTGIVGILITVTVGLITNLICSGIQFFIKKTKNGVFNNLEQTDKFLESTL